ncbi:N-acetylglutamate synthase, partial [Staphylococcus aureus]|nr:N-acetylglutamate synthase [Staphylococcus aureus]
GYSGCEIYPNCTYVQLNQIPDVYKVMAVLFDEKAMSNTLTHENVTIDVHLGLGKAAATAYGCYL